LIALSAQGEESGRRLICREDEPGSEFFVITQGEVRVTADSLDGEKEVARLGHGAFFGEMAASRRPPDRHLHRRGRRRSGFVSARNGGADPQGIPRRARSPCTGWAVLRSENTLQKMME